MTHHRLIPLAALTALLAACGDGGDTQEGEVTGEVLQGTISDEMLPLDQVRSEAPLADPAQARQDAPNSGEGGQQVGEAPAEPESSPGAEPAVADEEG